VSIWCLLRKIPICVGLFVEKDLHRQGVYLYSSPYSECVAYWHLPSTARDMWLKPVTHKRAMTRMYCTHTLPSTIAEVQAGPKMILPTLPLHLTPGHGDMTSFRHDMTQSYVTCTHYVWWLVTRRAHVQQRSHHTSDIAHSIICKFTHEYMKILMTLLTSINHAYMLSSHMCMIRCKKRDR